MEYEYTTDRLIIRVSSKYNASDILHFLERNREYFEPYESVRKSDFYTIPYQQRVLIAEAAAFLNGSFLRYYLSAKDNPDNIIGTISFNKYTHSQLPAMTVGYKTDYSVWRNGYTYEALSCLIPRVFLSGEASRLEALVNPDNQASIALLSKLGFIYMPGDTVSKLTPIGEIMHHMYYLESGMLVMDTHQ